MCSTCRLFEMAPIVINAAVNESAGNDVPGAGSGKDRRQRAKEGGISGGVDINSVSAVAAAITKTPGGVGPLTVSHLMFNVLKAYQLRHDNELHYSIYTEFLKMYGTYEKVRGHAPPPGDIIHGRSMTGVSERRSGTQAGQGGAPCGTRAGRAAWHDHVTR